MTIRTIIRATALEAVTTMTKVIQTTMSDDLMGVMTNNIRSASHPTTITVNTIAHNLATKTTVTIEIHSITNLCLRQVCDNLTVQEETNNARDSQTTHHPVNMTTTRENQTIGCLTNNEIATPDITLTPKDQTTTIRARIRPLRAGTAILHHGVRHRGAISSPIETVVATISKDLAILHPTIISHTLMPRETRSGAVGVGAKVLLGTKAKNRLHFTAEKVGMVGMDGT